MSVMKKRNRISPLNDARAPPPALVAMVADRKMQNPRTALLNGTAMRSLLTITGGSSQARWFARPQTAPAPLRWQTTGAMITGRQDTTHCPWETGYDPRGSASMIGDAPQRFPWTHLPPSLLRDRLQRALPIPETASQRLSLAVAAPHFGRDLLDLDGLVQSLSELEVVLSTLRLQAPFLVRTLSLRRSGDLFRDGPSAEAALALLCAFIAEKRENAAPATSVSKKPVSVCLEGLLLGDVESGTVFSLYQERAVQRLVDAWGKQGALHLDPRGDQTSGDNNGGDDASSDGKKHLRALTLRRKSVSYRPDREQRAALMPAWAAAKIEAGAGGKNSGKKGKKKKGKKKK